MNENPFRAQLAKELKNTPKEERAERLEAAQASEDYWQAKSDKLDQSAEWSEDRTELSWERKNVYHGTTEPEIESFKFAEESTIGNKALYFTVDTALAMGYAKLRSEERGGQDAHLYEVGLSDVKLQNWGTNESVLILKERLADHLRSKLQEIDNEGFEHFAQRYGIVTQEEFVRKKLTRAIEHIKDTDALHYGNIKSVAQGDLGIFFQEFVEQNGCDGILAIEGGDDSTHTSKPGISVVIYNPDKISWQKPYSLQTKAE